jgi:bifunctional non-homologous end joining protein LigD
MLAAAGSRVRSLDPEQWRFEPKLDGWRALVYVDRGAVTVRTRTGRDVTASLPELADAPASLRRRAAVLDGELVVGGGSASDFYRLGPRLARRGATASRGCPVTFMAFDILFLDQASTCDLTYLQRRKLLEMLTLDIGCCTYLPGQRSPAWVKVKTPAWRDQHAARRHQ